MNDYVAEKFIKSYDDYADQLFRFALFRTRHREVARDLVQDSFIRTWDYLAKGNNIDNFRAFLYRTLRNIIIDESRKKKTVSLNALQEEGFDPSDDFRKTDLEFRLDSKNIVDKLSELPEDDRDIVVMRYINELRPKEIAEILGESENVVSVRINRALKRARELLNTPDQVSRVSNSLRS